MYCSLCDGGVFGFQGQMLHGGDGDEEYDDCLSYMISYSRTMMQDETDQCHWF